MKILETPRLSLRHMTLDDAPFILELLSDADFIRFIGHKGVHNLDDAQRYITTGPLASYEKNGFGLYLVELRETRDSVGMCGFVKRDTLPHCDIGYAFVPRYRGRGYVVEAASAMLEYGRDVLAITRVLAITDPDNERSIRVLEKIGLRFDGLLQLTPDAPAIRLYTSAPPGLDDAGTLPDA
ncbi:MAG: GNAT family N-acetyltransferase [Gemmatimonadaceae bacterium]